MGRNYCKRIKAAEIIPRKTSIDSSYYSSEILEKDDVKPAFSRAATITTATKLFSSNRAGWFQHDGARAIHAKATITWLKKTTWDITFQRTIGL